MTQPTQSLFERLEQYLNPGEKAGNEAERICAEIEQRLVEAWQKIDSAQSALECCDDVILDQGLSAGIEQLQEHREYLEQRLAEAEKQLILLDELGDRIGSLEGVIAGKDVYLRQIENTYSAPEAKVKFAKKALALTSQPPARSGIESGAEPFIEVDGIHVDAEYVRRLRGQNAEMDFRLQRLEAEPVAVPEPISAAPANLPYVSRCSYVDGWNDCRLKMLAAAPKAGE